MSLSLTDGGKPISLFFRFLQYPFPHQYIFQHCPCSCVLASAGTFFYVEHIRDLPVTVSLYSIKIEHRPVANREKPDTFHYLFCLDDRRDTFFTDLDGGGMYYIDAFIELLVLLENIDAGVNDYPPYPTLKCPAVLKSVHLQKDLDKPLLQHILCIFPVVCKAIANCQ